MSSIKPLRRVSLVMATVLAVALPTSAQDSAKPVSDAAFIRGLTEMGLGEVVDRLSASPPSDLQEAVRLRDALIASYLPALKADGMDRFLEGVERLFAYQDQMLGSEAAADHWARPIWMADFAQQMMFDALPEVYQAGDFALVGFPDATQRRAVDLIAEKAYAQLSRAEDEQFRLAAILRADPDFVVKYVNTGRWDQLKTYLDLNIPFYRAWAIVYLLTQPDDGRYFVAQSQQGVEPAEARSRLIRRAEADIRNVQGKAEALNLADDTRARLNLLAGHLALEQGEYEAAIEQFNLAVSYNDALAYTKLLAELSKAEALQKSGQIDRTRALLETLVDHEAARDNPLAQLLITDRLFFIHYDRAMTLNDPEKQRPILADAFAVYDDLLASDRLGEFKGAIQGIIEERYKDQVPPGVPADKLPPSLRFAKVRGLVERGEALLGSDQPAEAKAVFEEAIAAASAFLKTPALTPATRAQTMYYLGFAQLRAGQAGYALRTLTDVAEQFPDTEWGERAIRIAVVNLAKPLYRNSPDNEAVQQLFERALTVLIDEYPNLELAALSTYDLAAFYRETEQYARAVEAYTKMPRDHPAYVSGQYEKIACLGALWADAPAGGAKTAQAQAIVPAVGDFVDLAERALPGMDRTRQPTIRQYIASAQLLKASVLLESMDMTDEARETIQQVERQFGDIEAIRPRILGLNIRIFQKAGQFDQAEQAILQYMRTNPEKAGPLALSVLQSLIGQVRSLAAQDAGQAKINQLADVAVNLAEKVVLPWAERQGDIDEDQRLAYELIPARALLAAGRADEALNRYNAIVSKFGKTASTNIDVLRGQAEAQYQMNQFGPSSRRYNRIIRHYMEQGIAKDSTFWHSYMRVMQMVDAQSQGKNSDIYLKIRNLKRTNPNLGGDPYAATLNALIDKHAP